MDVANVIYAGAINDLASEALNSAERSHLYTDWY